MAPRSGKRATRTQSALALAHRGGSPGDDEIARLRRQLEVDHIADHLDEIIAGWPPFTVEQIADLSVLLSQVPVEDQAESA